MGPQATVAQTRGNTPRVGIYAHVLPSILSKDLPLQAESEKGGDRSGFLPEAYLSSVLFRNRHRSSKAPGILGSSVAKPSRHDPGFSPARLFRHHFSSAAMIFLPFRGRRFLSKNRYRER